MAGNIFALYNDGMTNSRIILVDGSTLREIDPGMNLTRKSTQWEHGSPGDRHPTHMFDIPEAVTDLVSRLGRFDGVKNISTIVPIARGATVNLMADNGSMHPWGSSDMARHGDKDYHRRGILSYLNKFTQPEEIIESYRDRLANVVFDKLMSPKERYFQLGLPVNFDGGLIPGRSILALALETGYLQDFPNTRFAFGPEILARHFVVKPFVDVQSDIGPERTYLCCHTGLWDFETKGWSSLARSIDDHLQSACERRLIGDLIPEKFSNSWDTFATVGQSKLDINVDLLKIDPNIFAPNTNVLVGIHDSTSADIPVIAAFKAEYGDEEFIHFQAGSWGMARVIGRKGKVVLPEEGFTRSVLLQGDLYGNAVLTALTPTGNEFNYYVGEADDEGKKGIMLEELGLEKIAKYENPKDVYDKLTDMISDNKVFITPGIEGLTKGTGPFPDSVGEIIDPDNQIYKDKSGLTAYVALNLEAAINAVKGIELVSQGSRSKVVLSAGGAADPLFRQLLATLMPDREVLILKDQEGKVITETTAHGGIALALANQQGKHPYDVDLSKLGYKFEIVKPMGKRIEQLAHYREKYEDLAQPGK